mmetsp:Transcript_9460/g.32053  ORF Transcript_9460/g.32053 Transcript_9460/m.32053 type:complete len:236 (-) Transcript_9460:879-1586(-)
MPCPKAGVTDREHGGSAGRGLGLGAGLPDAGAVSSVATVPLGERAAGALNKDHACSRARVRPWATKARPGPHTQPRAPSISAGPASGPGPAGRASAGSRSEAQVGRESLESHEGTGVAGPGRGRPAIPLASARLTKSGRAAFPPKPLAGATGRLSSATGANRPRAGPRRARAAPAPAMAAEASTTAAPAMALGEGRAPRRAACHPKLRMISRHSSTFTAEASRRCRAPVARAWPV